MPAPSFTVTAFAHGPACAECRAIVPESITQLLTHRERGSVVKRSEYAPSTDTSPHGVTVSAAIVGAGIELDPEKVGALVMIEEPHCSYRAVRVSDDNCDAFPWFICDGPRQGESDEWGHLTENAVRVRLLCGGELPQVLS